MLRASARTVASRVTNSAVSSSKLAMQMRGLATAVKADEKAGAAAGSDKKDAKAAAAPKKAASKKYIPAGGFLPPPVFRKPEPLAGRAARPPRPIILLEAELRTNEQVRKWAARELRSEDRVPAVIYGHHTKQRLLIHLERSDITRWWNRGGFKNRTVLIQVKGFDQPFKTIPGEVTVHPVNDMVLHAVFWRRRPKHRVEMPVRLTGEFDNPVVKNNIGVLLRPDYVIPCYWEGGDYIPDGITLDVSKLPLHAAVHLSDIKLPEGLSPCEPERKYCLASVRLPKKQDES